MNEENGKTTGIRIEARYQRQLGLWRGIVSGLGDASRRALRQALIEDFAERRLSPDDVYIVERVLRERGESLQAREAA